MLCKSCNKKADCIMICPALDKDLRKRTRYQRETVVTALLTDEFISNCKNSAGKISEDPHDAFVNLLSAIGVFRILPPFEVAGYFTEPGLNFPFLTGFQNKVLHLFYFEGKTYKQIARIVSGNKFKGLRHGTNTQAIKNQLKSAKNKIRAHIQKNTEFLKNLTQ